MSALRSSEAQRRRALQSLAVVTPFSTLRVARPQTHPPATFSDRRPKLAEVRKETSEDQRLPTFLRGPSRTQQRAGRARRVPGLERPALARPPPPPPPPPPTPSPWENSERLPYQEQEAEDAPADHQIGSRRRHLRFRSRQTQRGGEGRFGTGRDRTKRDPELRSLKVKGAEGRSGGLPRRPGRERPLATNRAGAGRTRRTMTSPRCPPTHGLRDT